MLQLLAGQPENVAATATLLIRICTMWFGITLGLLIMVFWQAFLFGPRSALPAETDSALT
jgi:uncharacterized membrane protein YbhN (UPF0104 family)